MTVQQHIITVSDRHNSMANVYCMISRHLYLFVFEKRAKQLVPYKSRATLNLSALGELLNS